VSSLTIQPSTADSYLSEIHPDSNFGTYTSLELQDFKDGHLRFVLNFDFTALPNAAIITSADLSLYYWAGHNPEVPPPGPYEDLTGEVIGAYELTQTGWVETEVTWNSYKTGNAWGSVGGDYITTGRASTAVPSGYGWMNWDVLDLVRHFQSSHGKVANFLIKIVNETTRTDVVRFAYFWSNQGAYTPLDPSLAITYTPPIPAYSYIF